MDSNSSEATLGNGDEMPRASDSILEPIAIVGIAFKFPQGAESENSLWDKLMKQECTSTEWPKDRLNINGFWNPDPKKMNTVRFSSPSFLPSSGTQNNKISCRFAREMPTSYTEI